ncbi:outer membrane protein assembly factor BamD [Fluviicola sp.]|jgi:outer membrane protein assembly factor BamD|uniref:outer membrane protein assembly factor BamD n=1 Tax=Fluviicola sp. TaxID=1917219 RepID=UPI00281E9F43|nr:outer membrane protein assembly factor BamD [Fluviicola sp.]MDR0801240.1 outer membrane protein assembly factor BamD [Fluviicola sp.]
MKWTFLILTILSFASCSSYNSILKSDDYEAKFAEANRLYDGEKYERCVALYEQVYQRSPKTPQGEISFYRLGKASFKIEDWYLASYYLSAFQAKFPYSSKVEETMFLAAVCSVKNSPEAALDQQDTEVALNDLQSFVTRFPNSEYLDTCNVIMDKLRYKLETKEMMNVRLYSKTENYRAAVVSSEAFLDNYPRSGYREEAWAVLLRNSFHLALNSVDSKIEDRIAKTTERFNIFLVEFPNSDYLREFEGYVEKLKKIDVPASN